MPERSFPPVDDPARFDRIVQRGRALRRRRQLGVGAGAGSGVAAMALAVVLITGNGSTSDQVVADGDRRPQVEVTSTTTTTTTPPSPPTELTVELDADPGAITVVITDPAAPVSEDSRQCITVSLEGETGDTAEAYVCDDVPAVDGTIDVDLQSTGGVLINCAASMTRPPPDQPAEYDTELRRSTFTMTPPAGLAAGDYTVSVGATSGIGDGCAGTGDEAEPGGPLGPGATERSVTTSTVVTLS
jgi:hypothetical protein